MSKADKFSSDQSPESGNNLGNKPAIEQATEQATEQERAIHEYLEALLIDLPDETEQPEPAVAQTKPVEPPQSTAPQHVEPVSSAAVIGLEQLVAEVPEVIADSATEVVPEIVTETALETVVETVTVTELAEVTKQDLEVADKPVPAETESELESGVPEWAESRFQCLLFKVSGLSLAVPLVKLNSVIPWHEDITQTPNQTQWYLGLIQHLQNQVKVIDTALLVMPENRRDRIESSTDKRLSHILLVDDYKWGLACDSIGDVIWLTKDDVKWRKNKSTRAWLAGTSLEHLCAIMDTEVFAQMLNKTG